MSDFPTDFPYVYGEPEITGELRVNNSDFVVQEIMPDTFPVAGEHICLKIKKLGQNTAFVARRLGNFAGVREVDVSYCGLKDRHAITSQWFSVYFGKRPQPDWQRWSLEDTSILEMTSHTRKLRRGDHACNEFDIIVRNVRDHTGNFSDVDKNKVDSILGQLERYGVPNYFGEQRFGRDMNNLQVAEQWFKGEKRMKVSAGAMYISAARAFLFNHLLADRVRTNDWSSQIEGDILGDDGEAVGSLFGDGQMPESAEASLRLQAIAERFPLFSSGLRDNRIRIQHRPFVLRPKRLNWRWENDNLCVSFRLPVGAFATSLLREIVRYSDSTRE